MSDITKKSDVEWVVREHYRKLLQDELTKPIFSHLDLEEHLPRIFMFWCFVLDIDAANNPYKGSAFEPHTKLGLTANHFEIWLHYLHTAVKAKYKGPNADKWINKSNELGIMFQYKMGLLADDSPLLGDRKKD
jgi:truncated hemoglobin YjbI